MRNVNNSGLELQHTKVASQEGNEDSTPFAAMASVNRQYEVQFTRGGFGRDSADGGRNLERGQRQGGSIRTLLERIEEARRKKDRLQDASANSPVLFGGRHETTWGQTVGRGRGAVVGRGNNVSHLNTETFLSLSGPPAPLAHTIGEGSSSHADLGESDDDDDDDVSKSDDEVERGET